VPSNFTPERRWPVILLFDARARGRSGVERYQPAAEKYGYIVAGSNNSRNGPCEPTLEAAKAMSAAVRELDERLGLAKFIAEHLSDSLIIERAIRQAILAELGVAVRAIYLKPPRWIVKSTAGKPARSTTRDKFLAEHPEVLSRFL